MSQRISPFSIAMWGLFIVAATLLILPLVIVLTVSFTSSETLRFPPPGLSLRWYVALSGSSEIIRAAVTSLEVAALATLFSILLAVPVGVYIAIRRDRLMAAADSVFMSPMLLPAIAFGLALLMLLSNIGIGLSMATLVLGHTIICVPFVLRTTVATAYSIDLSLLEASRALGASDARTFFRIILPLCRAGIFAGAFIAFMMSFDHVPVSLFLSDARTEVLPIRLWYLIFHSLDVRTAAVSGVLVVVSFIAILVMERVTGLSRYVR